MAQSLARKIKRGHIRTLWNNTFQRLEIYKRVSSGRWVAANASGNLIGYGPGYTTRAMDKMAEE